jgi:putative redox protein
MSNLLAAAIARDVKLHDARAEIEGDLADAPQRYTAIRMRVSASCEPADQLQKLVTIAERGCIAANTLRAAVDLTVECVA